MKEFILTKPTIEYAEQIAEYRRAFLEVDDSMDGTGPLRRIESPIEYIGFCEMCENPNTIPENFGGHIGYSVRPDERRKGYAKMMLKMALPFCGEIGLNKVLVTCIDGNVGSEKTILANGGIYESTVHEPNEDVCLKRFWISNK